MAEINIEKKKSIWPWIIGALVALLILWFLFNMLDRDDEAPVVAPAATSQIVEPAGPVPPADTGAAEVTTANAEVTDAMLPISAVLAGTAGYVGKQISGTARVTDVPTDRGFWIEQDGQRMFAMLAEQPGMENEIDVNQGQLVQLSGTVHDTASASQVQGGISPEAMQILGGQQAFLLVQPNDVTIVAE